MGRGESKYPKYQIPLENFGCLVMDLRAERRRPIICHGSGRRNGCDTTRKGGGPPRLQGDRQKGGKEKKS